MNNYYRKEASKSLCKTILEYGAFLDSIIAEQPTEKRKKARAYIGRHDMLNIEEYSTYTVEEIEQLRLRGLVRDIYGMECSIGDFDYGVVFRIIEY